MLRRSGDELGRSVYRGGAVAGSEIRHDPQGSRGQVPDRQLDGTLNLAVPDGLEDTAVLAQPVREVRVTGLIAADVPVALLGVGSGRAQLSGPSPGLL